MNAPVSTIERLHLELPELDWITDPSRISRLSQDFAWFSPVLDRQLRDKRADAAVRPRTEEEIRALAGACARLNVPITIRGSGTGNYGQTTPLAGGVVLDMTGYNALQWVRPGVARAQAGIRLGEIEKHARPTGQELRCVPSTYRSATLGGLFGGGGSILSVAILSFVLGMPPKSAIAASLLITCVTSGAALIAQRRSGLVSIRTGAAFGGAGDGGMMAPGD